MTILVNNKPQDFDSSGTLSQLLTTLNLIDAKGIAIAINNQIIFKQNWDSQLLKENDSVTIIRATQGG